MSAPHRVNRAEFRKWLAAQADEGRGFKAVRHVDPAKSWPSWSCGCPIASYCKEVLGLQVAWAGQTAEIYTEDGTRSREMAGPWAAEFVSRVDRIQWRQFTRGLPATDVLAVLDAVP